MKTKAASGTMLTLLLTSMLTLAFNTQPVKAEPTTIVYVEPSKTTASSRTTFTININIANVADLYTWQFYLNWSGPLLNATKVDEGDFLKSVGSTFFVAKIFNEPDPIGGCDYVLVACTLLGDLPGVNGGGTLATITFLVEGVGESTLHLYETLLLQSAPNGKRPIVIGHTTNDGYLLAKREVPVISVAVDIDPDTLNLKNGRSKWITAYIELPEGYRVSEIDILTVKLNGEVPAELYRTEIRNYDEDGISNLMVKFNRQELWVILNVGEVSLTITGEVKGIPFEGTDTIRVIDK